VTAFSSLGARLYTWFHGDPVSNRLVIALAELGPEDCVLDVGCGPGAAVSGAAELIGARQVAAVDPTLAFVERIRSRVPGVDVREAEAESLPFADDTFTVVWSISAMHHWADRAAGLAETVRVLAPGGRLLLMESALRKAGHGITPEQADQVMRELRALGLAEVDAADHRVRRRKTYTVIKAVAAA